MNMGAAGRTQGPGSAGLCVGRHQVAAAGVLGAVERRIRARHQRLQRLVPALAQGVAGAEVQREVDGLWRGL